MISHRLILQPTLFLSLAMLVCCHANKPDKMIAEYSGSRKLDNYPSGSTISYFKGELYLMGDDASALAILDADFNLKKEIILFSGSTGRIKKTDKADIESSEWITVNNKSKLWLFGSGSLRPQRDSAFCYDPETEKIEKVDLGNFYKQLHELGIPELNIEAAALVKNTLLFGSRGNLTHPQNFIIQTQASGFPGNANPRIIPLNLPDSAGISGMTYLADQDILLITSSIEYTANAFDDGEIGGSYLGIVHKISEKLAGTEISPDEWIELSKLNADFVGQKIESVCTLKTGNETDITAVLVSDDDKGGTGLFRIKLKWQPVSD